MGKKRKSFREAWEDDEWGIDEGRDLKRNDRKKRQRKQDREQKFSDRWYDDEMNLKQKKTSN